MDTTTKRSYIYHESSVLYLKLLDMLKVEHTDYTTQACLMLLFSALITTYLLSIRWLSETLLAQDLDQHSRGLTPQPQPRSDPKANQNVETETEGPTQQTHSLPLRALVYFASAIFFALPALYLQRHPPSFLTQPTLVLQLRPLAHYLIFTLSVYILLTFLLATILLYGAERFLFAVLTQLEKQRQRRIRTQGRDSWLDALDGGAVKLVREVHAVARKMWRELVRVEMWGLPFRGWVWEPVWKGVRGWCGSKGSGKGRSL